MRNAQRACSHKLTQHGDRWVCDKCAAVYVVALPAAPEPFVVQELRTRAEAAEAERDAARKMLAECYVLAGAEEDEWEDVWADAVDEVRIAFDLADADRAQIAAVSKRADESDRACIEMQERAEAAERAKAEAEERARGLEAELTRADDERQRLATLLDSAAESHEQVAAERDNLRTHLNDLLETWGARSE